jgi:hypothetical protein
VGKEKKQRFFLSVTPENKIQPKILLLGKAAMPGIENPSVKYG